MLKMQFSLKDSIVILSLLGLNIILKIFYLDFGSISGDEPFTIFYAQQDISDMLGMFKNENNPPLHFMLLHYWIKIFGISPFSTRFLSLIFSSATAVFIYKLAKRSFNIRVAVIASLLFTFSNYHIYYAHETRVYALFALLTTVSMYAFLSMINNKKNKKYLALLFVSNVLLLYAHFFGFFVLAIQALSILSIKELRKTILKEYSILTLVVILFYVPYLQIFISRFLSSSGGTWVETPNIESLYNNLWKFSNAPVNTVIFLLILVSSSVMFFVRKNKELDYHSNHTKVIIIWFLFPYLFLFLISFLIPMFLDRYLIFISIAFYISIAIAVDYLFTSKWLFYSIASGMIAMMIFTTNLKSGHPTDLEEIVQSVKASKNDQTVVFLCPGWMNHGFAYHYNLEYFKDYKNIDAQLNNENIFPVYKVKEVEDSIISNKTHIVYLDGWSELVDPKGLILKKLEKNFRLKNVDESHKEIKIYYFVK